MRRNEQRNEARYDPRGGSNYNHGTGSRFPTPFVDDPIFGGSFSQAFHDPFFHNPFDDPFFSRPFEDPFFSRPFEDPFFTRPFGFAAGPSILQDFFATSRGFPMMNEFQARQNRQITGPGRVPMIEEVPEDHPLFDSNLYGAVHDQPLIEHPEEEEKDSVSDMEGMSFCNSNNNNSNHGHTRSFHTSSVSFSVNNGERQYTSYLSQKRGPDDEIEIQDFEYDSSRPNASQYHVYSSKGHGNQESRPQLPANNYYYIEDDDSDEPQPKTRQRPRSNQRQVRNIDITWS